MDAFSNLEDFVFPKTQTGFSSVLTLTTRKNPVRGHALRRLRLDRMFSKDTIYKNSGMNQFHLPWRDHHRWNARNAMKGGVPGHEKTALLR
jgi:hypothetical protein